VLGVPLLADALAHLECEVAEEVTGGTHTVFLAEVRTGTSTEAAPLAYFRGQFGRVHMEATRQAAPITRGELVLDALDARCTIELGVVRRIAGRLAPAELARLRAAAERTTDFHDVLVELGGSEAVLAAYHRLGLRGLVSRALPGSVMSPDDARHDHEALANAIEAGAVEAAQRIVMAHAESIKALLRSAPAGMD
jgi:DNA-binding FadR family transcriptional regulator